MDIYMKLEKMNITLPTPPPKGGLYAPVRVVGNLLFISGVGPTVGATPAFTGKVGGTITPEHAMEAAQLVAVNILSILHNYLGDLNKIKSVVKILAFVASDSNFNAQPSIINAASQVFNDLFPEGHARSAIGTNELPNNIPVEIEAIFELHV